MRERERGKRSLENMNGKEVNRKRIEDKEEGRGGVVVVERLIYEDYYP